jgi:hypothetical protein
MQDGSHGRGGGDDMMRGPVPNRELMEMRDAIIHCDGSPEVMRSLARRADTLLHLYFGFDVSTF